jgi:hypothetical protein
MHPNELRTINDVGSVLTKYGFDYGVETYKYKAIWHSSRQFSEDIHVPALNMVIECKNWEKQGSKEKELHAVINNWMATDQMKDIDICWIVIGGSRQHAPAVLAHIEGIRKVLSLHNLEKEIRICTTTEFETNFKNLIHRRKAA